MFSLKQIKISRRPDAYEKALALEPDLAAAWVGRGNVFFRLKAYEDALAAYNEALKLEPNMGDAWLGAGNVLFELKQHDGASSAYDSALERKPDLAAAWLGRAMFSSVLKKYEEAVAAYDNALARKPDLIGVEGLRLHAKAQLCDWSGFDDESAHLISAIKGGKPNTGPFQFLAFRQHLKTNCNAPSSGRLHTSPRPQVHCGTVNGTIISAYALLTCPPTFVSTR
jgi:tetratricopeptide (TPR) repeat protein